MEELRNVNPLPAQTVRNLLHDAGLNARRPARRIPLQQYHTRDRLESSRHHVRWTLHDWTRVMFSDEFTFCVDFTDMRAREWRMRTEWFVTCRYSWTWSLRWRFSYCMGGHQCPVKGLRFIFAFVTLKWFNVFIIFDGHLLTTSTEFQNIWFKTRFQHSSHTKYVVTHVSFWVLYLDYKECGRYLIAHFIFKQ